MPQEARAAITLNRESPTSVADRLAVTRMTVYRWLRAVPREFSEAAAAFHVEMLDEDVDLPLGRWARRVGTLRHAPYVVGCRDEHRYQRAAFGEISYWLRAEGMVRARPLRAWRAVVFDPRSALSDREEVLHQARRALLEARPELAKHPATD